MLLPMLLACAKVPPLPVGDGSLSACWSSPNCVSTQADPADATHYVAAVPAPAGLDTARLEVVVVQLPGCEVTDRGEGWVRAACHTPSGLFTDDLDVMLREGQVHARSSSRLGYGDLGVNRARVEALFAALR